MKTPKITITFPVFREETLLFSCLNSIGKLDYPQSQIEVVLVDNGLDSVLKKDRKVIS